MKRFLAYNKKDGTFLGDFNAESKESLYKRHGGILSDKNITHYVEVPNVIKNKELKLEAVDEVLSVAEVVEHWKTDSGIKIYQDPSETDWVYVKGDEASGVADSWGAEGSTLVLSVNPANVAWTHVEAVAGVDYKPAGYKAIIDTEKQALKELKEKRESLNTEVYNSLEAIFGTKKSDTVTRMYLASQAIKNTPQAAVDAGFIAEVTIASFTQGELLDTTDKVIEYAEAIIGLGLQYALEANKKIKENLM